MEQLSKAHPVYIIDSLVAECFKISQRHGFWQHLDFNDTHFFVPEKVALAHTELSEVIKADRDGELNDIQRGEEILEELADTVIRVFDLAAAVRQSIGARLPTFGDVMIKKMEKNAGRPRLHGKRY